MPYLIDGHNLIAALPDIALDDPDDEVKLVHKLRAWCAHTGRKAILYFDGGLPGGVARDLSTSQLRVIFAAAERSSADALIKAQLQRLKDARNWTVVTSDREILAAAHRRGAHTLKSQAFAAELAHISAPPPADDIKPEGLLGAELEHWLAEFSQSEEKAAPPSAGPAPSEAAAPATSQSATRGRSVSQPPRPQRAASAPAAGVPLGDLAPALKALRAAQTPPEPHPVLESDGEKPPLPDPEEVAAWLQEFPELEEPIGPPPPKPAPPRPLRPGQAKPHDITRAELAEWLHLFGADSEVETPERDEDADTMARLFGPRRAPRKKRR